MSLDLENFRKLDLFILMNFSWFFSVFLFWKSWSVYQKDKNYTSRQKQQEYRDQKMKILNSTEINPILKDFTENYTIPNWMVVNFYLVVTLATILTITCFCAFICQCCARMCENWNRCCGDCCNCCTVCLIGSSENCTACTIRYKEFVVNQLE